MMEMSKLVGRSMGIDVGEKHIGVSISDPSGTISRPLCILKHTSYQKSATAILNLCNEYEVQHLIIGISVDEEGEVAFAGRKALRLGNAIQQLQPISVVYWDEMGTTQSAQQYRREMGIPRKQRRGHLDDLAACILLQSFLDNQAEKGEE